MKKKFSFVLAIVLIVCTLSLVLAGCSPKDPEPFKAYDKNATLSNIMDAWVSKNISITDDTFGLDVNLNLKNADTDFVIALKGGLSKIDSNANKEGISLTLQNNKLQTANKKVLDVVICSSGLYFDIAGYTEKPIRVSDFSLPLEALKGLSFASIVDTVNSFLLTFITEAVDDITIDPVMNGKNIYDVTYSFDIVISKLIDSVVDLLSNFTDSISANSPNVIQIKEAVGDFKISVAATTTGNKREKVANPKKDQPKYKYEGGTLSDFALTASKDGVNIAIGNEIKLQGTLPELSVPSDYIELEAALFPTNVNGSIVMKNASGTAIGKYDYTANIDFDVENIYTAIIESLSKQSIAPLFDKMFKQSSGKIFVEITHTCDNSCAINHLQSNNRPIMTIAYDPTNFGTNRIYVAVNTRAILAADFGEKMTKYLPEGSTKTAEDIVNMLPQDDLIFSFDPTAYVDYDNATAAVQPQGNILIGAISTLTANEQTINIKQIVDMLLSMDELAGKEQMIKDIVSIVFPNVQSLDVSSERTQNAITDNLKERFLQNRAFAETLAGGSINFAEQFDGIVKITSDTVPNLYDNNDFRSLTLDEIYALIGSKVTGNYVALNNSAKSEQMTITDIIGVAELDLQSTEKQTLYLVIGGELGSNLYDFTASISEIFGTSENLTLAALKEVRFVEAVIKIQVTLA